MKHLLVIAAMICLPAAAIERPIMGWSSWNTYRVNISDSLIMKQAYALKNIGLDKLGYQYVNIDDGFFGQRNEQGVMQSNKKRFPHGVKTVVDYIHSLGLKAGIYSDAGAVTCGSIYDNDADGIGAGLYGHEAQDAQLYFKKWGFDFIKIDYCGAGTELNLDEQKRYTEIKNAFDREGCQNVKINICRWAFPGTWAASIASSWRISSDISPCWQSIRNIIAKNLYYSAYARDGHYNDMDMLELGRGLSTIEEETHLGMWCMMSSPLLIGCDLTTLKEFTLNLLKNEELIAINQDALGQQAYVVKKQNGCYVLTKDLQQERGLLRAVAFYNPTDTMQHLDISSKALELGGKLILRDVIKRKNIKSTTDNITVDVAPHGVKIYSVKADIRLEPTVYEAEMAYLPLFNDLNKIKKSIGYTSNSAASGQMVVSYAGGSPDNVINWDRIWSERGGNYTMTISYVPKANSKLNLSVNGKQYGIFDNLNQNIDIATLIIDVILQPGYNIVTMGSSYTWTPDIDKIELRKKQ